MKIKNKYICIIFSGLSINLAFVYPAWLNWLALFYLVPIFYLALKRKLTFKDGFLWSALFYSVHFYYLWIMLFEKGNNFSKYLVPIFLVFYFSIYSGIWFYLINFFYNPIFIIAVTFLNEWFIYNWSFWIFQCKAGYVLSQPVLPLLINKTMRLIIKKIGLWSFNFCLIALSFLIAKKLSDKTLSSVDFPVLLLFIIIIGVTNNRKFKIQKLGNVGYISLIAPKNSSPYEIGQLIMKKILDLTFANPKLKIILMPETAFPYPLNEYKEIIRWWYNSLPNRELHILIGAHRKEGNRLYNSVYHLYNNKIINYYDKTHLVCFAEYIPSFWLTFNSLRELFLKEFESFNTGQNNNVFFDIDNCKIQPCICSEIYLNQSLKGNSDCICLFANESWFRSEYIKNIFLSYIILKKMELNKDIIYISDTSCLMINDKFID